MRQAYRGYMNGELPEPESVVLLAAIRLADACDANLSTEWIRVTLAEAVFSKFQPNDLWGSAWSGEMSSVRSTHLLDETCRGFLQDAYFTVDLNASALKWSATVEGRLRAAAIEARIEEHALHAIEEAVRTTGQRLLAMSNARRRAGSPKPVTLSAG